MRNKANLSPVEIGAEIEKIKRRLFSQDNEKAGVYGAMNSGRRERLLTRLARLENERMAAVVRERKDKRNG